MEPRGGDPWINFEEFSQRPTPGTVWKANLNRWDGVEPNRRMSICPIHCSRGPRRCAGEVRELVFVQ
jgi:hypothetical protein